jgi:hypothetical protein
MTLPDFPAAYTRFWGPIRAKCQRLLGATGAADEEFRHVAVAVASGQARGRWSHLSQGVCPAAGGALPLTLVVDDEPGSERLAVVFSRSRLDPPALDEAIEARRLDTDAWVTRFELAKDVSR